MGGIATGRSLELYFIDGVPDGMLTAEVFNWTGHVLSIPRTRIVDGLRRSEAGFTGVYLLTGEKDGEPCAYIGEGENVANRIKSHDANREWWDRAVLVTTGANNLNKAHVQYLESRLIELAKSAAQVALENGTAPGLPSLSEAARSNMEGFLEYLLMILPALRIDLFDERRRESVSLSQQDMSAPEFELHLKSEGIVATARLIGGEFVVQAGSMARGKWIGDRSLKTAYWKLHDALVEQGILVPEGKQRRFTNNYAFSSTSAAGAVVTGRSTAGPISWKVKGTDRTYKEWEAEQLAGTGG